jgi:hypothetical protein
MVKVIASGVTTLIKGLDRGKQHRDEQPPLDAGALGSVCGCSRDQILAFDQPVPKLLFG